MDDRLLESLAAAVSAAPDDLTLRLHLARLLVRAQRRADAVSHLATVLAADPTSSEARELMAAALGAPVTPPDAESATTSPADSPGAPTTEHSLDVGFDWTTAEEDLGDVVPPMFVEREGESPDTAAYDVERFSVRLSDVGGLTDVKARLEAAFLAPLRNPELRQLYGKSLRGGLLLYGPPGCGKTFLAKAVAGELGANFLHVSLADILDMYIGNSERNVAELFRVARETAPCVLFLDELDAIGQKRALTRNSAMRGTVNQLLTELDGVNSSNDGVFVLAATNHPWDVDSALRRPGRLDRTLLVLPPDLPAREAILRTHLADRPLERIDIGSLAKATEGFSGADLAHLCDSAAEEALMEAARSGTIRMITMADFHKALADVKPSIGPWLEVARNVAHYANESGEYDELARFLRKRGRRS